MQVPGLHQETQNSSHSCISFHLSDSIVLHILFKIIHPLILTYSLELHLFLYSFLYFDTHTIRGFFLSATSHLFSEITSL